MEPLPRFNGAAAQVQRSRTGSLPPPKFPVAAAQVPRRRRPGSPPRLPRFAVAAAQFADAAGVVARVPIAELSLSRPPGYSGEGNFVGSTGC
jgi:hypothetical protein